MWSHFQGPGLEISKSPRGLPAQKVTFLGVQFRNRFPRASEGSRGEFWALFWRVLGPCFVLSEQDCVRHVKKVSFGVFLGAKSKRLVLQKHANRTVHPLKIEGVLPMAYIFQKGLLKTAFCSTKASSGGFKLYPKALIFGTSYEVLIFDCLGVVLGTNLSLFWRA